MNYTNVQSTSLPLVLMHNVEHYTSTIKVGHFEWIMYRIVGKFGEENVWEFTLFMRLIEKFGG